MNVGALSYYCDIPIIRDQFEKWISWTTDLPSPNV